MRISILSLLGMALVPVNSFAGVCATVLNLRGSAEIVSQVEGHESRRQASLQDSINCGDRVVSKSKGSMVLEVSNGKLIVGPDSVISINGVPGEDPATTGVAVEGKFPKVPLQSITLMSGEIRVWSTDKFNVNTSYAIFQGAPRSDFFVADEGDPRASKAMAFQGGLFYETTDARGAVVAIKPGKMIALTRAPEDTLIKRQIQAVPRELLIRTRLLSVLAINDSDFTQGSAIAWMGPLENWNKTKADEQREANERQLKFQQELAKEKQVRRMRGSYFQHQTEDHEWEVNFQPQLGIFSYSDQITATNSFSVQDIRLLAMLGFEFGLSKMFSFGLNAGYAVDSISVTSTGSTATVSYTTSSSTSSSGLQAPQIYLNGRSLVGNTLLKFGGTLTEAPGISENIGSITATYSQTTLTPFVGVEGDVSGGRLGARLSRDLWKSAMKITSQGQTITANGGVATSLIAFWEHDLSKTDLFGIDIGLQNYSATTSSATSQSGSSVTSPHAELYWSVQSGVQTRITPTFGYMTFQIGSVGSAVVEKGFYLSMPLRYTF